MNKYHNNLHWIILKKDSKVTLKAKKYLIDLCLKLSVKLDAIKYIPIPYLLLVFSSHVSEKTTKI